MLKINLKLDRPPIIRAPRTQAGAAFRRASKSRLRACSTTGKRRDYSRARLGAASWRPAARRRWPRHRSGGGERDACRPCTLMTPDAGARQLSPRQPARGAADRQPAGCVTSTITCSTTCCAASASTCRSKRRRSSPREAPMSPAASHAHAIRTVEAAAASAALCEPRHVPQLLRLLHLASPALPIGAFHFSQGLEYA